MQFNHFPKKQGLYDPQFEHDNCGVGFVCNYKGIKSYDVILKGIQTLEHLVHRGATGADPKTGDGAGILIQMPHEFFAKQCGRQNIQLPDAGKYAVGMVFLPPDKNNREYCEAVFENIAAKHKLKVLGWREVPVKGSILGKTALKTKPVIKQVFLSTARGQEDHLIFEQMLYIARKKIENVIRLSNIKQKSFFYISSLSSRVVCYKGLLISTQLKTFYPDLEDSGMKSSFALIHARYSTNTFPTWDLAQPFRYLAHNGEINTLRGNINWMQARQGVMQSKVLEKELKNLYPIVVPGGSDSASIDNVLELLVLSGRSIPHAMMMLVPEAWQNNMHIDESRKAFYEYHACLMEPWDGPAAIAFTDGRYIGAILDRNGLRPARYSVTKDSFIIMASEAGALDIPPEDITQNGRLQPGRMFLVDTEEGRIIEDEEIKRETACKRPYKKWLEKHMVSLDKVNAPGANVKEIKITGDELVLQQKAFGYSREDLRMIIKPMALEGQEPTGSMGDDTPLAVLSTRPRMLYDYFKQLFAQVTNPPIDPIREELVMTLDTYLGREKNLIDETPEHCHRLKVRHPVLANEELEKIRHIKINSFKTKTISTLFDVEKGINAFNEALDNICRETKQAMHDGYTFVILSDRDVDAKRCAIPALLAIGAVHHFLIREATRTQVGLIIESGEPREVAHFALLFGYGADCINPYLAYDAVAGLVQDKEINLNYKTAQKQYIKALEKGILKILSKMGISTLQSYRGAQIFEALGLNQEVISRCFTGTVSRIGGIGMDVIAREALARHGNAFGQAFDTSLLQSGGLYQWRRDGEIHLWNPDSVFLLQQAARNNDSEKYKQFSEYINNQQGRFCTLRSLLKFKTANPVPVNEVEPASEIVKRFVTGAMSFGSLSKEAHETIAKAMNRLGGKSNSGEGGENPQRFVPLSNGDNICSSVKQVASGRFGVTINYLTNAKELQIKIAQGAKPGEGGQLPGHKVSTEIAKTRYATPGVTLISPPPHHDIYSIEDLAQLIFDLKNANPDARISVKLVSEAGVGTVAAGVAKGHADMILISGGDGGTGASPLSSIKHAGLPWELGLSETHQTLVLNDLRSRVRLQTDGQMRTGRDVVIAALLGAEEYGFATSALIVLGCTMLRHCNLNNCALGIATQDECLRKRFNGKPEYLENYFKFIAEEVRMIMAQLGIRKIDELIGRTDLLEPNRENMHEKIKEIDFSKILYKPDMSEQTGVYCSVKQDHSINDVMDLKLSKLSKQAIDTREQVIIEMPVKNTDRTVGAMVSGHVIRRHGEGGLSDDTIYCKFHGTAGQSFGAFLARGLTFELEGSANDYVGKGLSGGKIIIYPSKKAVFKPEENIIMGNTTFYGATNGEAYIRGIAGERFCIRNSGIYAVVEGVGDHGCEYMTGGRVIVLGKTGLNFAAGMSGGIAYVYDENNTFPPRCNMGMVIFDEISEGDGFTIYQMLSKHYKYTQSLQAKKILDNFKCELKKFVKVMPVEYKRVLEGGLMLEQTELAEVSDG